MKFLGYLIALAGLAAAAFFGWQHFFPPAVTSSTVARGNAAEVVYATGVVEPLRWAKVVAVQRKRITFICDCEGKAVKKGDVLVQLDDAEERAQLVELESRRSRIGKDIERVRSLVVRNAATQTSLEQLITQAQEFDARIAAQKNRINDLTLRAPMDGVVLRKDGEVGEVAGTGANDVLFWVGPPRPLQVVADVSEDDIPKVASGLKALLRSEAFPAGGLSATVDEFTPKGDPLTRTFRVYLALPADTPLKIGMSVEVNIISREKSDVLLVPAAAILDGAVFVINAEKLVRKPLETGIRGTRMVEVIKGVSEGDTIVSPVTTGLRDGMRVRASPAAEGDGK